MDAESGVTGLLNQYLQAMGIDRWTERGSSVAAVNTDSPPSSAPLVAETPSTEVAPQTFHFLNFQSLAMVVGVDQKEAEALPDALQRLCSDFARAYNRAPSRPVVSVLAIQGNRAPVDFSPALSQLVSTLPRPLILVLDVHTKISAHTNKLLDLLDNRNSDYVLINNLDDFQASAAVKRKFWEDLMASKARPRDL